MLVLTFIPQALLLLARTVSCRADGLRSFIYFPSVQCSTDNRWPPSTTGSWPRTAAGCGCRATRPSSTTAGPPGPTASSASTTYWGELRIRLGVAQNQSSFLHFTEGLDNRNKLFVYLSVTWKRKSGSYQRVAAKKLCRSRLLRSSETGLHSPSTRGSQRTTSVTLVEAFTRNTQTRL